VISECVVSSGDILVLTFEASQLPRDATPAFSPVTLIDSLASTPREHLVDHRSTAMATLQYLVPKLAFTLTESPLSTGGDCFSGFALIS